MAEDGHSGTFLDGYLKVINPDDYLEPLQDSYFRGDVAFSYVRDSIWRYYYPGRERPTWKFAIQYNIQDLDIICKGMDLFIRFLDNEYITKKFELDLYRQVVLKHGTFVL